MQIQRKKNKIKSWTFTNRHFDTLNTFRLHNWTTEDYLVASECHAPEGWCGFRVKDQIRQRAHRPLSHQKLLKLGPGGSSGYNSADQTCTCLLGLGERSQSIPAPLSLQSRVYGMSKWKHGASCRAVTTKDEGHRGKTIYCILDIIAGDYTGEDLQGCFD